MIVHILFNEYFNRGYDCAMIGYTQFFLWSRYSDIISLLTITLRGVPNKHCLLPFFITYAFSESVDNQFYMFVFLSEFSVVHAQ